MQVISVSTVQVAVAVNSVGWTVVRILKLQEKNVNNRVVKLQGQVVVPEQLT